MSTDSRDIVAMIIRGDDAATVRRAVRKSGISRPDPRIARAIREIIEQTTVPHQIQAGYCLATLRSIIEGAMDAGDWAAARGAVREYWTLARDMPERCDREAVSNAG
jgi:hypothetical protein